MRHSLRLRVHSLRIHLQRATNVRSQGSARQSLALKTQTLSLFGGRTILSFPGHIKWRYLKDLPALLGPRSSSQSSAATRAEPGELAAFAMD